MTFKEYMEKEFGKEPEATVPTEVLDFLDWISEPTNDFEPLIKDMLEGRDIFNGIKGLTKDE